MEMEMELPGAASLASFHAADEKEVEFTDELKHILEVIAWTGNYWHDWALLKSLLSFRLKQVLTEYCGAHVAAGGQQTLVSGEAFSDFQRRLLESLDSFSDGPPFTLQRLCELLLNPRLTYPNVDKVSLAFEKLLLVTSTISACNEPYPSLKRQQGWNQAQETGSAISVISGNGAAESRNVVDEEMVDVVVEENKQANADKVPSEEASLSLEKRKTPSEEAFSSQPHVEKEQERSLSSLMDDELDTIALVEAQPVIGA